MGAAKRLAIAFSFLALLLFSGCTGIATSSKTWKSSEWDWAAFGGISLAAMAALLGIAYMASVFLNDEQMRAWVSREVMQLGYSAFILACLIALSASIDSWLKLISLASPSLAWQDYVNKVVCCDPATSSCIISPALAKDRPCHIALAMDYLQILFESARTMANAQIENYYFPALLSQVGASLSLPGMMDIAHVSIKPFTYLAIDVQFYSVLIDLIFKTMLFLRVQQTILDFAWGFLVPLMIGIGIALRTFHFSRKLGGMLIALALSLYIVFPMMYVLMGGILFGFVGDWTNPEFGNTFDPSSLPAFMPIKPEIKDAKPSEVLGKGMSLGDICGTATQEQKNEQEGLIDGLVDLFATIIKTGFKIISGLWNAIVPGFGGDRFGIDGPVSNLAMLMVFTLVTPFLALMTMLASFKYFSPLIGGDVEISLLSRLI